MIVYKINVFVVITLCIMVVCLHVWVQVNLVYSIPCTGVVRARTHCDILQLSRSDTTHVVHHFPDSNDKFYVVLCYDMYFLMSRYSPTSYTFSLCCCFSLSHLAPSHSSLFFPLPLSWAPCPKAVLILILYLYQSRYQYHIVDSMHSRYSCRLQHMATSLQLLRSR